MYDVHACMEDLSSDVLTLTHSLSSSWKVAFLFHFFVRVKRLSLIFQARKGLFWGLLVHQHQSFYLLP